MVEIDIKDDNIYLDGGIVDKKQFAITFQEKINNFLREWNLGIRPLTFSDLSKLEEKDEDDLDHIDKLCGKDDDILSDMLRQYFEQIMEEEFEKNTLENDIVPIVILKGKKEEWEEEKKEWVKTEEWDEKIYCFLAEHFYQEDKSLSEILSFSVTYMNKNNIKNGLYFETSCTLQSHHCSKSLNYFIRVYSILEMLKNDEPIKFIWGCMAGNDQNKLRNIHINRGCNISQNDYCRRNPEYQCNISSFLTVFFNKMEKYSWDQSCKR